MNTVIISWLDLDKSVLEMSPMELLQASTQWTASKPDDEAWLATSKPTTAEGKYYVLALSLDAYHQYTELARDRFLRECDSLHGLCGADEIAEMKADEEAKGNPGHLCTAESGLLRIHVPVHLIEEAKMRIKSAFEGVEGRVVQNTSPNC